MIDIDIDFLEKEEIDGPNRLKIFKYYGTAAALTDFAISQGASVNYSVYADDEKSLENRTGYYWTKTDDGANDVRVVNLKGYDLFDFVNLRFVGSRPTLKWSEIRYLCSNIKEVDEGILEAEIGFYVQQVASEAIQEEWAKLYEQGKLVLVDKITTDARNKREYDKGFKEYEQEILEYEGKRKARVKANTGGDKFTLSNGKTYKDGTFLYYEGSPIRLIVDVEKDKAVFRDLIFAGIQFNDKRNYKGDFKNVTIKKYMDTYLVHEIGIELNLTLSQANPIDLLDEHQKEQKRRKSLKKQKAKEKKFYSSEQEELEKAYQSLLEKTEELRKQNDSLEQEIDEISIKRRETTEITERINQYLDSLESIPNSNTQPAVKQKKSKRKWRLLKK